MDERSADVGNWNRWGRNDQRGMANLLTPESILNSLSLAETGRVVRLGLKVQQNDVPVFGGRAPIVHTMRWDGADFVAGAHAASGAKSSDDYLFMGCHSGTHIDALAHAWDGDELYNGVPQTEIRSTGAKRLGIEHLGHLIARGVLIDCVTHLDRNLEPGEAISKDDLETVLDRQGVELAAGDVVVVRTGWLEAWLNDRGQRSQLLERQQGLSVDTVGLFAASDTVAVGADNFAVEVWPSPDGDMIPFHRRMIRDYGVYLIEVLDLEELANEQQYEFTFIAAPLPIRGGTGSPINPLAVL